MIGMESMIQALPDFKTIDQYFNTLGKLFIEIILKLYKKNIYKSLDLL